MAYSAMYSFVRNATDEKQRVKDLIKDGITQGTKLKPLKDIILAAIIQSREASNNNLEKDAIESATGGCRKGDNTRNAKVPFTFSTVDHAYINHKYIKYCLELLLEEVLSFGKELIVNQRQDIIVNIFRSLNDVRCLTQIPDDLRQLKYYQLLMENYALVSKHRERNFIKKFTSNFLEQMVDHIQAGLREINFLQDFRDFLLKHKNITEIADVLQLAKYCSDDLSFDYFLEKLMSLEADVYGTALIALQETAGILINHREILFTAEFKKIIGECISSVEINTKTLDGRLVIEVIGTSVVISQVLDDLQRKLVENSRIEEIRISGTYIVHIDADLCNEFWHGKNIIILAKNAKIYNKVVWNVSGQNSFHIYPNDAGTNDVTGHGEKGADGHAGESGGNVLIYADHMENSQNFTIISHGGNGSNGQNGGNGKDGKDGKGIKYENFKEKFPSVVTFLPERERRQSLLAETIEFMTRSTCINKSMPAGAECLDTVDIYRDYFFSGRTNEENDVTFSYTTGCFNTYYQAYLFYKGSVGQIGGYGGENGLSGQGGYEGEVISNQKIVIQANAGTEGEHGEGGYYGQCGRNGWDVAYMDWQLWRNSIIYGRDESTKLNLCYTDEWNSETVWCSLMKKYVKFTQNRVEHKKLNKYKERRGATCDNKPEQQAQAVKKKSISQRKILGDYAQYFNSTETIVSQDLQSYLKNINDHALQIMSLDEKRQEKVAAEVEVRRHVVSDYWRMNLGHKKITTTTSNNISKKTTNNTQSVQRLIDELKNDPLSGNWFQLKKVELNRCQLEELYQIFQVWQSIEAEGQELRSANNKLQSMEQLLNDKYRGVILHDIANQLMCNNVTDIPQLTAETAARFLVIADNNDTKIDSHTLGRLDQYLYMNKSKLRKQIFSYTKKQCRKTRYAIQKHAIKAFVLEVGNSEQVHPTVRQYYVAYEKYVKNQEHSLNIYLELFLSELKRHHHMFALWTESRNNTYVKLEFKKGLEKLPFLNNHYKRVDDRLNKKFDWDDCYKNPHIREAYNKHVQEKGALSAGYRELLAYAFDVNIRVYTENRNQEFSLLDNNNPSDKILHILQRDNKVIRLIIDEKYKILKEQYDRHGRKVAQILAQIEPFQSRKEFDSYLQNRTFLPNVFSLENMYLYGKEQIPMTEEKEYFSSVEESEIMIKLLEKIAPQYIGHQGILSNILKRFSNDGIHVSTQELDCLVNSILRCAVEDAKELNIFCWIVAAYPQKNWIDELLLLQLEKHFRKPLPDKSKLRRYLSKIENKDVLLLLRSKLNQLQSNSSTSMQCIDDALYLLSYIPDQSLNLEDLEISEWCYSLKEKFWVKKLAELTNWQNREHLLQASYYLSSMENTFGYTLVNNLTDMLKIRNFSTDILMHIFYNFHCEQWSLSKKVLEDFSRINFDDWSEQMWQTFFDKEERDVSQLVEIINGNPNTCEEFSVNLHIIEELLNTNSHIRSNSKPDLSALDQLLLDYESKVDKNEEYIQKTRLALLNIIDGVIHTKHGFKLRDTQKLAILALLANQCNTLAQMSTGEGKSLIVVAVSIITVLLDKYKVDVITSSTVLAKHDAQVNKDIYDSFNISVAHNCSEDIEKRKEAYSGSKVVYGNLSNFQRDYLLDRFYGKNILGDRQFDMVIVDEVDSMLLDKGNNTLYLSHDLAGLDKLESVYIYLWQWICISVGSKKKPFTTFNKEEIKRTVLYDLYGLLTMEDIKEIGPSLDDQQMKIIWEALVEAKIIDNEGKMLERNVNDDKPEFTLPRELSIYKDRLDFIIQNHINRHRSINVPNYLKPFMEQHLDSWINSAIMAVGMRERHDYVTDVDRSGSSSSFKPNITILDRDTGTDQVNSQWDEALHQFLQLKHACKLCLPSLKAVFISNVSYLKLYNKLYGLTGTLGSQRERDLLKQIHNVEFVTIPTARPKKFSEKLPIVCANKEKWLDEIFTEAMQLTTAEQSRSVLIICETIDDVESLHKIFLSKNVTHVYTYTREYEEFNVANGDTELKQGRIIISTNLAGRGTDIKISKKLRKAGGLHVCLTYLPNNSRIHQQAYGRAARKGEAGSGQLIIMVHGWDCTRQNIADLMIARDASEIHRLGGIKMYYETQIMTEERCFNSFKEQYHRLQDNLVNNKLCVESRNILLQSCLDKWAFWLDSNSELIRSSSNAQIQENLTNSINKFNSQLQNFKSEDSESWSTWIEQQPIHMIKLGKYFNKKGRYDDAIRLFTKVIELEPHFSEAAHYYKAVALINKIDWSKKPAYESDINTLKMDLQEAARLFNEHSQSSMYAAACIHILKQDNDRSIVQIDSYKDQQETRSIIYGLFSKSVDDILGKPVTRESFVNCDISEDLADVLYEDLLEHGILKKTMVIKNISKKIMNRISVDYGISIGQLEPLLSEFKGREITEKEFTKTLKTRLNLPSREDFWKLLIERNILNREIKYVIINVSRLSNFDSKLLSLLCDKSANSKNTLHCNNPNTMILHNIDDIPAQDCIILQKSEFKDMIMNDTEKYQFLKKREVFSFNKTAYLDFTSIDCSPLPRHDCISLKDFSKVNISDQDAKKILAELVTQKVLDRSETSENCIYRLIIPSSEISQIQLLSYPVYETTVKTLLSRCFIYRIVLETIVKQQDNLSKHVQLISKSHHKLMYDLMDQGIIKAPEFNSRINNLDLEEKLKSIYSSTMTKKKWKTLFSQNALISKETDIDDLCNHVIEKSWLFNGQQQSEYTINPLPTKLPFCNHQNLEEIIRRIFGNRVQLSQNNTTQHIIRTLTRSAGSLKTSETLCCNLKPLSEFLHRVKSKDVEEVHTFNLNDLQHVLQISQCKWSATMLLSCAVVIAIGLCQVAIGVVLMMCIPEVTVSVPICSWIIAQGLADMLFAIDALTTGSFSWKNYVAYKRKNVVLTAARDTTCALYSKITTQLNFSKKLSSLTSEDIESEEQSRNVRIVTPRNNATNKSCLNSAMDSVSFGLNWLGYDVTVQNQLQALCDSISSNIRSNIENNVNCQGSRIGTLLLELCNVVGEDKAKEVMDCLMRNIIPEETLVQNFITFADPIALAVSQEIAKSVEQVRQRNESISSTTDVCNILSKVLQTTVKTDKVQQVINSFLDDLIMKITNEIIHYKSDEYTTERNLYQYQGGVQEFKDAVIDQWKSVLLKTADPVIDQHITEPIFNQGGEYLINYCKKLMKKQNKSLTARTLRNNCLEDLTNDELHQILYAPELENVTEVENYTVNEYHKNLLELTVKTKNHRLLAVIIRENFPINVYYINTFIRVIWKMLKLGGLTVIVKRRDGTKQEFSAAMEATAEKKTIELELTDDYFRIHGSGILRNNGSINNCLYEALQYHLLLQFDITREVFRAEIANYIELDHDMQYQIEQAWYQLDSLHGEHSDARQINMSIRPWADIINEELNSLTRSDGTSSNVAELRKYLAEFSTTMIPSSTTKHQSAPEAATLVEAAKNKFWNSMNSIKHIATNLRDMLPVGIINIQDHGVVSLAKAAQREILENRIEQNVENKIVVAEIADEYSFIDKNQAPEPDVPETEITEKMDDLCSCATAAAFESLLASKLKMCKEKSKSLDWMSFSSLKGTKTSALSHHNFVQITKQQIQQLNLKCRNLPRRRHLPNGRSKSLERCFVVRENWT